MVNGRYQREQAFQDCGEIIVYIVIDMNKRSGRPFCQTKAKPGPDPS
jgi:hypothetical protein